MDSLLHAMNTFTVKEGSLDDLISKTESVQINDPDDEWVVICKNYSKIKYLSQLITFFSFPETVKFKSTLLDVLNEIDKKNKYYLYELTWEETEYEPEFNEIKELFEQSLKLTDPFEKIKVIMNSYKIFIPIIEDYRREKCINYIDDPLFLHRFDKFIKKRKYS